MTTRITMPQFISPRAPMGSLLKPGARGARVAHQRSPRLLAPEHLAAIRQLPCLKCGMEPCGEAAHVQGSGAGKALRFGRRPDDKFALPLDASCHRLDADAQHKMGEAMFWDRLGLNPLLICEALWAVSPDIVRMRAVVLSFMAGRGDAR